MDEKYSKTKKVQIWKTDASGREYLDRVEYWPRCQAMTADGTHQCNTLAKEGQSYCGTHLSLARRGKTVKTIPGADPLPPP